MSECSDCGGDVEPEVEGNFRDWRCQECGRIVGGGELVVETE
jgi:DNA-directed RNA polymerase subunit RPC12/RpoP